MYGNANAIVATVFCLIICEYSADSDVAASEVRALRCAVANSTVSDDLKNVEECSSGDTNSDISPHCYVVFRNNSQTDTLEVTFRGCWTNDAPDCIGHARLSEEKAACQARSMGNSFFLFCCCIGDMCNRDFEPLPPIPDTPLNASLNAGRAPDNGAYTYSKTLIYVLAPTIGLVAIVLLSFLGQLNRRKCLLARQTVGSAERSFPCPVGTPMLPLENVTLIEQAAQGSSGTVWRGQYNNSPVAVKISPAGERQSWLNEEKIYRSNHMQHANILRFVGVGQQLDSQTNLMEYWLLTSWHDMGSLYDYLRFNTVTCSQILQLSDSIAKGVMHLHTDVVAGKYDDYKPAMAHRDLKSRNIIMKNDRTACIADFGLAIVFEPGAQVGNTHCQVGTRRYMSPEVLEGAISFDREAFQRIDMYAVALILWEILSRNRDCDPCPTYRLPFEEIVGLHPSMGDMQEVVVNQKQRPFIKDTWRGEKSLSVFITTLEECWDSDADARLSASTMHERLQSLISQQAAGVIPRDEHEMTDEKGQ
ncbi:activin receptor type-2A-like [Galendromus occidentalis]|uniref:Serine/threonine-protein kinase receptor n=1 Tax=Galendromus occidentalis TaxID=34638 RepID=A0AAJ6QYD2_9ACAR|nr:activin receptor type-2A-like [Galendromus occidentalis]